MHIKARALVIDTARSVLQRWAVKAGTAQAAGACGALLACTHTELGTSATIIARLLAWVHHTHRAHAGRGGAPAAREACSRHPVTPVGGHVVVEEQVLEPVCPEAPVDSEIEHKVGRDVLAAPVAHEPCAAQLAHVGVHEGHPRLALLPQLKHLHAHKGAVNRVVRNRGQQGSAGRWSAWTPSARLRLAIGGRMAIGMRLAVGMRSARLPWTRLRWHGRDWHDCAIGMQYKTLYTRRALLPVHACRRQVMRVVLLG